MACRRQIDFIGRPHGRTTTSLSNASRPRSTIAATHLPPQSCRPGGGRRIGSQHDGVASDLVVSFEKRPERDDVDIDAQEVTERLLEMDQIQK